MTFLLFWLLPTAFVVAVSSLIAWWWLREEKPKPRDERACSSGCTAERVVKNCPTHKDQKR